MMPSYESIKEYRINDDMFDQVLNLTSEMHPYNIQQIERQLQRKYDLMEARIIELFSTGLTSFRNDFSLVDQVRRNFTGCFNLEFNLCGYKSYHAVTSKFMALRAWLDKTRDEDVAQGKNSAERNPAWESIKKSIETLAHSRYLRIQNKNGKMLIHASTRDYAQFFEACQTLKNRIAEYFKTPDCQGVRILDNLITELQLIVKKQQQLEVKSTRYGALLRIDAFAKANIRHDIKNKIEDIKNAIEADESTQKINLTHEKHDYHDVVFNGTEKCRQSLEVNTGIYDKIQLEITELKKTPVDLPDTEDTHQTMLYQGEYLLDQLHLLKAIEKNPSNQTKIKKMELEINTFIRPIRENYLTIVNNQFRSPPIMQELIALHHAFDSKKAAYMNATQHIRKPEDDYRYSANFNIYRIRTFCDQLSTTLESLTQTQIRPQLPSGFSTFSYDVNSLSSGYYTRDQPYMPPLHELSEYVSKVQLFLETWSRRFSIYIEPKRLTHQKVLYDQVHIVPAQEFPDFKKESATSAQANKQKDSNQNPQHSTLFEEVAGGGASSGDAKPMSDRHDHKNRSNTRGSAAGGGARTDQRSIHHQVKNEAQASLENNQNASLKNNVAAYLELFDDVVRCSPITDPKFKQKIREYYEKAAQFVIHGAHQLTAPEAEHMRTVLNVLTQVRKIFSINPNDEKHLLFDQHFNIIQKQFSDLGFGPIVKPIQNRDQNVTTHRIPNSQGLTESPIDVAKPPDTKNTQMTREAQQTVHRNFSSMQNSQGMVNDRLISQLIETFETKLRHIITKNRELSFELKPLETLIQSIQGSLSKLKMNKNQEGYIQFQKDCNHAIEIARPALESHRGYKLILSYFLLFMTGIGALILFADLANKAITGKHCRFFQTDTAQKVSHLEELLNQELKNSNRN